MSSEAQNEETSKSLTISRSEDTRKRPRRQLSDPDPDAGQRRRRQEPIQPSALDKGKARQSDSDDIDFEESDNSSTIVTRTGDPSVARSLPPLAAAASPRLSPPSGTGTAAMSRHSSSAPNRHSPTASTGRHGEHPSQLLTPSMSSDPRAMSQNNKDQLIQSLRTHRVNTITELRRIEKIFAYLNSAEVTEPMTSAWRHYVNSNNLLNELRGLTKRIPFSSEALDEAKALVVRDPNSVRSWNYCWLVLVKMEKEGLVAKYARTLASKQSTWGERRPSKQDYDRLVEAAITEWTQALRQMLKHWDGKPPSTTGR